MHRSHPHVCWPDIGNGGGEAHQTSVAEACDAVFASRAQQASGGRWGGAAQFSQRGPRSIERATGQPAAPHLLSSPSVTHI